MWDGLGRTDRGDLILVEAKSHIGEMVSPPSQAGAVSRRRINAALSEVRDYLGVEGDVDWTSRFYQYTSRLAHLYLLRVLNDLPAWLVFVHFVNVAEMRGPSTREEWIGAINVMRPVIGVGERHRLSKYVVDVFVDVQPLDRSNGSDGNANLAVER